MFQRLQQIRLVFDQTRESDPRLVPYMVAVAVAGLAVPLAAGLLTGRWILGLLVGLALAPLAAMLVLSRRASSAQYDALEGQAGAAVAVMQSLRGPWHVTPVVVATRKQDFVHRAVGKPGVVLVGEGSPARVKAMLKKERQKMERVVGDTPVHTVVVGEADGAVALRKLRVHLMKLPRELKKRDVGELETRLQALGGTNVPIPKGPIPRGGRPR